MNERQRFCAVAVTAVLGACGGSPAGSTSGGEVRPSDAGANADSGLRSTISPGGNFDLSLWELQEPVGSPGVVTVVSPAQLEGPTGFQDSYFYTDPTDGAMTFWDPENGVVTPHSNYPRSELAEVSAAGSIANWPIAGHNTLSATLEVVKVPDHVCVGQVHIGLPIEVGLTPSTKPLLELYYASTGAVVLGIETMPEPIGAPGTQTLYVVATVPLGTKFSYSIGLAGSGEITVVLNGVASAYTMPASFNGYGMYFKAGDYNQSTGPDPTVGATVKFYALNVAHEP
jgi:hypothetical protein